MVRLLQPGVLGVFFFFSFSLPKKQTPFWHNFFSSFFFFKKRLSLKKWPKTICSWKELEVHTWGGYCMILFIFFSYGQRCFLAGYLKCTLYGFLGKIKAETYNLFLLSWPFILYQINDVMSLLSSKFLNTANNNLILISTYLWCKHIL